MIKHLYSAFQGFVAGAIVMAYVADYNRSRLPIATLFFIISIIARIGSED